MLLLAVISLLSSPLQGERADRATGPVIGKEASIPFIRRGRLRDFAVDRETYQGVYIQDHRKIWYYAKLIGPCPGLHYSHVIGIKTKWTSRLDRDAEIAVEGDLCAIDSFTYSAPPPPRKKKPLNA